MTNFPAELIRRYLEEAERVRGLASQAADSDVRDALFSVVRQYEDLAYEPVDRPYRL